MKENHTEIYSISFSNICREISQSYAQKKSIAHQNALSNINEEQRRFFPILHASQRASFEKVAETIGLDGISEDFFSFIPTDTEYSHLKPLVSCEDLSNLFMREKGYHHSMAINTFYDVEKDSPLYSLINSMDLASGLSLYKHQCVISDNLPHALEINHIYIQLQKQQFTCTVLCPFGNNLSKKYEMNNFMLGNNKIEFTQKDIFLNALQSNAHLLLLDLYYGKKIPNGCIPSFNVFSESLIRVDGFKSHVIKTIRAYNQELIRSNGLSSMLLTKQHLMQSIGQDYCGFEILPQYQDEHTHHEKILKDHNNFYYAEVTRLNEECQEAIHQARIKFEIEQTHHADLPKSAQVIQEPVKIFSPVFQTSKKPENLNSSILKPVPRKYGFFKPIDQTIKPCFDDQCIINEILTMPLTEISEKFFNNTHKKTSSLFLRFFPQDAYLFNHFK